MTREEAIARLEMMFQECSFPQKRCKGDCCTCSKAISALSKVDNAENPKRDLISRADAIEAVGNLMADDEIEMYAFYVIEKALKALPPAEPKVVGDIVSRGDTRRVVTVTEPSDVISRADAIKVVYRKYPYNAEQSKCDEMVDALNALPSADRPTHDCTNLVQWLLEETMDEESWRENADANGEIICRKLKKLGVLDTKDGYYIRTPLAYEDRPSGEWLDYDGKPMEKYAQYSGHCSVCGEWSEYLTDYCGNCGARMKGGAE